jgi:hypothetical protein
MKRMRGAGGTETVLALAAFSFFFLLFIYVYVSGILMSSAIFNKGYELLKDQLLLQQVSVFYSSSRPNQFVYLNTSNTVYSIEVGSDFNGVHEGYGRFVAIGNDTYYMWVNS